MKNVKLLNWGLWALNMALGAGIFLFAILYLLDPEQKNYLDGIADADADDSVSLPTRSRQVDYSVLYRLKNPLTPKTSTSGGDSRVTPVSAFNAELKGTWPPDFAFLSVSGKTMMAQKGKTIELDGKAFGGARGWKLVECYSQYAVFSDGRRRAKLEVKFPTGKEVGAGFGSRGAMTGKKYNPKDFSTRRIHKSPSREVYSMDPREIEWANQNLDAIMERDVSLSVSGSGGLRVDSVNSQSIGFARGMRQGDVIRSINGQPMKSLSDIKKVQGGKSMKRRKGMTIVVKRRGRNVVLEYRPQRKR